jgi:cyclohexa-1,5-dienecarbonyl-CoA hydratase
MANPLIQEELLRDGRVLRLALDSPKGNILTSAMGEALRAALARHASDRHLRLVILHGAGGNFCYGASVEEHRPAAAPGMLKGFHQTIREVVGYPVPIAAAVEGQCLGGGFELALACHLVFAKADAALGCPEIKLGVFPPVLAALGPLRLGAALTERLILTGATIGAAELAKAGALTGSVDGDLPGGVLAWYDGNLASLSAAALRQATRAARVGSGLLTAAGATLEALEAQYLREVVASHDGNEGIEAFLARRAPVWSDA